MEKISNHLIKLSRQLFADQVEQEKFINIISQPEKFSPGIVWLKNRPIPHPFITAESFSWQPEFCDRLSADCRPGQYPLHEQGDYYCLDFSSIFAATVLSAINQPINIILDMCASPGGKSIFAWRLLQPELIICNETIGKRLGMLFSNLKRCGIQPYRVSNKDSQILADNLPNIADLVIVDAPCTGQSLLVKGEKNPGCFHPVNINQNANRQKRILANAGKVVKSGGYLAYMTCTYSPAENEIVGQWFSDKFPSFQPVIVEKLSAYQSHLTDLPCYRIFPQSGIGAGAFTMLWQNQSEGNINQKISDELIDQICLANFT